MKTLTENWDFVEKYFPNYYSSDEILNNNTLTARFEEGENVLNELLESTNKINKIAVSEFIENEIKINIKYDSFSVIFENSILIDGSFDEELGLIYTSYGADIVQTFSNLSELFIELTLILVEEEMNVPKNLRLIPQDLRLIPKY